MTSTTAPTRTTTTTATPVSLLRTVLRLNAASSAATGLLLVAATGPVGDLLGVDRPGVLRLVGLGLLLFAADVALVARGATDRLVRFTPAVSAADAAWVSATVVFVAVGAFSTAGGVAAAVVGAAVAGFGVSQWALWRRLPGAGR